MKPTDSQPSHILLPGTELPCNYIVNNVLGEGGFGITYSGTYTLTGEKVAIKEYFPTSLAHREWNADNTCRIVPFIESEDSFSKGREHFLNEASILKEFQNLNSIVSVMDVIEANDTVYLVMEFIDGITLKQYVTENGTLTFAELLPLVRPVIQALTLVHKKGLIHRDISPENLMIGIDNQLHLIDFGAASIENAHDAKTMTVILKTGYAPPEQYLSDGKQGAWTDIYGLCATMYMTLTGFQPPESIKRFQQDNLPPLASNADISSWQAAAIERGMNLAIAKRYQNMEALYQALVIPPIEIDPRHAEYLKNSIEENKTVMPSAHKNSKKEPFFKKRTALVLSIGLVILLCVYSLLGILGQNVPYWPKKWIYQAPQAATVKPQISISNQLSNIGNHSVDTYLTIVETKKAEEEKRQREEAEQKKKEAAANSKESTATNNSRTGNTTSGTKSNNNSTNSKDDDDEYNFTTLDDDEYNFTTLDDE